MEINDNFMLNLLVKFFNFKICDKFLNSIINFVVILKLKSWFQFLAWALNYDFFYAIFENFN